MKTETKTCRHCGRAIVSEEGRWIDPEATGDDSVWRETCDSHDTFTAEHEPGLVVVVPAFTFEELDEPAKDRARSWLNESGFTVDDVSTLFETELGQRGLGGLKTCWSLGHVQGDGVGFKGAIDLDDITPILGDEGHGDQQADEGHISAIRTAANGIAGRFSVQVRGGDIYGWHVDVEHYCDDPDECDANAAERAEDEVRETVTAWLEDLAGRLARMGYAEIEYRESAETCEANGYLFSKYGNPIHHLAEGGDA